MGEVTRLLWLGILGLCAVVKFLVEWIEEHARKQVRGATDEEDTKSRETPR